MIKYDCIFIDRDGTINYDPGYISELKDFEFFEFTISALKILAAITDKFIMITNQSGVRRGLIKEIELLEINDFILDELRKNNIPILKIYYCTDHPDFATKNRKPGTGMFLDASKEFDINLSNCLMIGDSISDILPANILDMDSMLVLTGNGEDDQSRLSHDNKPTYVTKNILTGAKFLTQ